MSLTITKYSEAYTLEGKINTTTVNHFTKHINTMFESLNELTIDISKVEKIDKSGIFAIIDLASKATESNKSFSVIGDECDHLFQEILTAVK